MAVTFNQLIQSNKRKSWLLIICFCLFVCLLGGLIGYALALRSGRSDPAAALPITGASIAIAAIAAGISGLASYYGGAAAILTVSRARQITHDDDPQLFNVVEEMSIAAGLPMPKVYVIDDSAPNAFATGRDPRHAVIAVTTGLRGKLKRDELQAVIAHEMSHVRHLDIRFAVLMATLVGMVVLMCDMFLRSLRWGSFGRSRRSSSNRNGGGAAIVIVLVLALLLSIIAPIIAKILEMAFSRQREFLADAGAVELTRNPDAMCSALQRISGDHDVLEVANRATAPLYFVHPIKHFEERASSIFDSHPPIAERIARIRTLTTK